jgi:hypothetical protein
MSADTPAGDINSPALDTSKPNIARMYDYWLGGKDNFAADREAAQKVMALLPDLPKACRDNRLFLQRAVHYITEAEGIRQFIDIGTGLPTMENVHEAAQAFAPDSRVAYVDYDPVVVRHAQALLAGDQNVIAIGGDLRKPGDILRDPQLTQFVDLRQPIALMLVAILHFIPDEDDPCGIVSTLKQAMAPGSFIVISHATGDHVAAEESTAAQAVYAKASAPIVPRSHAQVTPFFGGLRLLPPGLVNITSWPEELDEPARSPRTLFYGGIGVKQN